jgi:hypothetical protein
MDRSEPDRDARVSDLRKGINDMNSTVPLRIMTLLLVFLAGCSCTDPAPPPEPGEEGEIVLLDLSWLLPKNEARERVATDAELLVDGKSVWTGHQYPTDIHPEYIILPIPRLRAGHHEFRVRVGDRNWDSEITLARNYVGVVHLHCSTGDGTVKARLWEDSGGYE